MTTTVDEAVDATTDETAEEVIKPSDASLSFETKKFVLQALLDKASSVLPSRDVMQVLKNFQVEVAPGILRVVATDLELSVLAVTEMVNVTKAGTAVFPGKRLIELVREADDSDIIFDVVDGQASIRVGRTSWNLMLQDGSEYPPLADTDDAVLHEIDRGKFLGALQSVRYAAATDTVRPSLMLIDVSNGKMRAADGTRYQQVDVGNFPMDLQIPIGAVDDLIKLLRSTDQNTLQVGETESALVFAIGADLFIAQKLNALFPDVDELLLKPALGNDQELHVDRDEFMAAIKRVRVTADTETSAIILALSAGKMTVKSRDKFGNWASETLDVFWDSPDREVAVNHSYMMDMLTMTDAKSCRFFLGADSKTRKSPVLLKDDEAASLGVLNQMRVEFLS